MSRTLTFLLLLSGLLLGGARAAQAQDFVYEPKNPAFGGNTFSYSWLLSSAQAQNTIADPTPATSAQDPLASFTNNLNQQVLSQLSSRLIASQFGQGAIRPGSYAVGNYQIQITPGASGIAVQVTDITTGNQTTITIPNGQ